MVNSTVHGDNLVFCRGEGDGWDLTGNSSDSSVEDEGFMIEETIIGMIAEMEQAKGVDIIL